ncbi:MAG: hypothetical protein JSS53_01700 [Proteobacteria bacterium]|nr:hypothetical protein [Pseudomonadota bacterium]
MKLSSLVMTSLVLMTSNLYAATATCPDLSQSNHPNPLSAGWQISPFSSQSSASGIHVFSKASITLQRFGGNNTISCAYQDGLVLLQVGCFMKPVGSNNWFNNGLGADVCSGSVTTCQFESISC